MWSEVASQKWELNYVLRGEQAAESDKFDGSVVSESMHHVSEPPGFTSWC